jgi:hypothetical protein
MLSSGLGNKPDKKKKDGGAMVDGLARNGCELDLTSDSANCGACGHFCSGDCVQKLCRSP